MAWNDDFNGVNIQSKAVVEMFWKALNERAKSLWTTDNIPATEFEPAAGAIIQSCKAAAPGSTTGSFSWRYLQSWIESYCVNFVQCKDLGGAIYTNLDGKSSINHWTVANLKSIALANGGNNNWMRKYRAGDGTITTAYGLAQAGDILGPWILREIRDCFNLMIWTDVHLKSNDGSNQTGGNASWSDNSLVDELTKNGLANYFSNEKTWAEFKLEVEADYTANTNAGTMWPCAYTTVTRVAGGGGGIFMRQGQMTRAKAKANVVVLPSTFAKKLEYYVYTSGNVYDAESDGVADLLWKKWAGPYTVAQATTTHETDVYCGGTPTVVPNWCAEPANDGDVTWKGWKIAADSGSNIIQLCGLFVLVRWEDSFTYK